MFHKASMKITRLHTALALLLMLALLYLGYAFLNRPPVLFSVYDVDAKYTSAPAVYTLSVVDFNKYGCDHCQALHPVLMEAVRRDGAVRYMPRLITFGHEFETVISRAVYAAAEQGKFIALHDAIYKNWPVETEEGLFKAAADIGLDVTILKRDMKRGRIKRRAAEDFEYFKAWKLGRTPTLLMGYAAIYAPGEEMPSVEEVLTKFNQARAEEKQIVQSGRITQRR